MEASRFLCPQFFCFLRHRNSREILRTRLKISMQLMGSRRHDYFQFFHRYIKKDTIKTIID